MYFTFSLRGIFKNNISLTDYPNNLSCVCSNNLEMPKCTVSHHHHYHQVAYVDSMLLKCHRNIYHKEVNSHNQWNKNC